MMKSKKCFKITIFSVLGSVFLLLISIKNVKQFIYFYSHRSSTIDACTSLHEKWQQHHRAWFSSNLSESENKLVLAEENWRRSRLTSNVGNTLVSINGQSLDKSYPQRNLRDLMEELRSSSSQNKNKINSMQSQSDYTAADLIASSDSDLNENEDEDDCTPLNFQTSSNQKQSRLKNNIAQHHALDNGPSINEHSVRSHIAQRKKLPTPSPTAQVLGLSSHKHRSDSKSSLDDSVYSSLSNEVYSRITVSHDHQSPHKSYVSDNSKPSYSDQVNTTVPFSPQVKHNKNDNKNPQTLKDKLRECALVSESGTASVIEVIEPTLSEEEEFQNSIREMSWNISINGSRTDRNSTHISSYLPSPRSPVHQGRSRNNSFFATDGKSHSPISIFPPKHDERSSIITITSSNSNTARSSASSSSSYSIKNATKKFGKGNRRPQLEDGTDGTAARSNVTQSSSADYNEDSSSNRYSTYSDISPTKRLLEMGITTEALDDNDNPELDDDEGGASHYTSLRQSSDVKNSETSPHKIAQSPHSVHSGNTYVIKKKKPHPTSITVNGNERNVMTKHPNSKDAELSSNNITNLVDDRAESPQKAHSANKNSSKITFTDLDFLQEHFVDDSFDSGDMTQVDQDGDKMSSSKKTTFLQKIASKTKWNNMKKKINTPNKENNIETTGYKQNSLNGSPLISQRNALSIRSHAEEDDDEELEEHILPDSFEDLPGDSNTSGDLSALNKDVDELALERNNNDKISEEKRVPFGEINSIRKSLSPSSRTSFMLSTSSTINSSSTATMKSSSGISANSVASTSEDSGIGLLASSGSVKLSDPKPPTSIKPTAISNDALRSSVNILNRSPKELSLPSTSYRMDVNEDLSFKNLPSPNERVVLSKIDEASSVASQSSKSCNSELLVNEKTSTVSLNITTPYSSKQKIDKMNEKNLLDKNSIATMIDRKSSVNGSYTPIISTKSPNSKQAGMSHLLEQSKLKRNFSKTKAWYDIPSDEDPEAPEADSLASIITHRSHSSEED